MRVMAEQGVSNYNLDPIIYIVINTLQDFRIHTHRTDVLYGRLFNVRYTLPAGAVRTMFTLNEQ